MAISVHCPGCNKVFKVSNDAAGKKGACPNCGTFLVIGRGRLEDDIPAPKPSEHKWRPGDEFPVYAGHKGAVNSVCISYGATLAFSAGEDGTIRTWDVDTGRQRSVFEGHKGPVNCVSLHPDGYFAISGGDDGAVRIWDLSSGKCARVMEGHADAVRSVAFGASGPLAVSGSADATVRMWDANNGKCLRVLKGHKGAVEAVGADMTNGEFFFSGSTDRTLRLWRLPKGKGAGKLKGHGGAITCAAYSPDGGFIVSGSTDRNVVIWSVNRRRPVKILKGHQATVHAVGISSDNATAVSGGSDWVFRIWNVDTGKCAHSIEADQQPVTAAAIDHDGRYALAGYSSGALRLYDAKSGALLTTFGGEEHSATVGCPGCKRIFQIAERLVGRKGLCPYCKASFTAAIYSPAMSQEALAAGRKLLDEGRLKEALQEIRKSLACQGDNRMAILGGMQCYHRMGMELAKESMHKEALQALERAVALYSKGEAWPAELVASARQEAYAAAFLAAKTCRFHLADGQRALKLCRTAQKFNSTVEVQDMMSHLAGPARQ